MKSDSRILVLAPHPDDEVVACGIAALRARSAGVRIFVIYLTTGVPARGSLWPWQRSSYGVRVRRRVAEARAVASFLGIEPVGFRQLPARRLRFDLDAAAVDLHRAIQTCSAEALWVPAFEGGHQDHDAANALAAMFAGSLPVWEFAAYQFAGGRVSSNEFIDRRRGEMVVEASVWEAARKRDALGRYASESGNLKHVGTRRETGRPLPVYDYNAPPHPGKLFRERFHWVPLRHPRIDFDPSGEVYRQIGEWVSARGGLPLGNRPGQQAGEADGEFAGALDQPQR
jgi:LmbE family N-acetylglucosaminyl deacetylase